MKKYKDIDEFLQSEELTQEELVYKRLMEEIPKHNKKEENILNNVIYQRNEFIIIQVQDGKRRGFIVQNTKKPFSEGHTHLKSLDMAKVVINNVINKKIPKSKNEYIIISHIRVTNDEKYRKQLEQLLETRKQKGKQNYYNSNSKKV